MRTTYNASINHNQQTRCNLLKINNIQSLPQNMAKHNVKGGLSRCKRWPFAARNAAFCIAVSNHTGVRHYGGAEHINKL